MVKIGSGFFLIIATLDTKGPLIQYLKEYIMSCGETAAVVDIGILGKPTITPDIDRDQIAGYTGHTTAELAALGRTTAVERMTEGLAHYLAECMAAHSLKGVIGIGGCVGTTIVTSAMRNLPLSLPKVVVSTFAYDIRSDLQATDIVFFYSVIDLVGLNTTIRTVLAKAAGAVMGMAAAQLPGKTGLPQIAISCLGITTPGVMAAMEYLESRGYEVTVFHMNGIGGSAFEQLIQTSHFSGVIDFTTHEINGVLFDGIAKLTQERLGYAATGSVPYVILPGGLSVISRGPFDQLSAQDRAQKYFRHSAFFTHIQLTPEQMNQTVQYVAAHINQGTAPAGVLFPLQGFTEQDRSGCNLFDPEFNQRFIESLTRCITRQSVIIRNIDAHINDTACAIAAVDLLIELMNN